LSVVTVPSCVPVSKPRRAKLRGVSPTVTAAVGAGDVDAVGVDVLAAALTAADGDAG
jgi:hypothetical protein